MLEKGGFWWSDKYPDGVDISLDYPKVPLHQFLYDAAEKVPDNTAAVFMNTRLTFKDLAEQVDAFAGGLAKLGLKQGDKLGIMLPNCPQFVIAFFAALRLGVVVIQINPMYVPRELEEQLVDAQADAVLCLDLLYPRLAQVSEAVGLRSVIVTSVADYLRFPLNVLYRVKTAITGPRVTVDYGSRQVHRFLGVLGQGGTTPLPEVEIDPEKDVAILQYTGGTTGTSKGAMLSHANLVANTVQTARWIPDAEFGKEKILAALPFFHVYGMTTCMNLGQYLGASVIMLPRFEIDQVLEAIDKHKPTLFPGAPTMYVAVNNHPKVSSFDISSIRACISGSAPLPVEVAKEFEGLTGGRLVEGYGLTEAAPVTHCNPIYGLRKFGSIGLPFPDTLAKIVDAEDPERELPHNEIGELAVKGPQVMLGYWQRPDETVRVLTSEGWLLTGDMAKCDEDGYFYIVDRKKDMICAAGFNIYPREIEEVLYEHPSVLEAAVIGLPDEYRGETVKAYLVLREGEEDLTEGDVITYCRDRLASFKVPRAVEFRAELPKTMVGKVLRRALVEEEMERSQAVEVNAGKDS